MLVEVKLRCVPRIKNQNQNLKKKKSQNTKSWTLRMHAINQIISFPGWREKKLRDEQKAGEDLRQGRVTKQRLEKVKEGKENTL